MITLIVDNHPVIHEVLGGLLRSVFSDAQVLAARTLSEAIEHLRATEAIDIAFLDPDLPDCSGLETLVRFRGVAPATRVIVFSAVDDSASILRAMDAGADGYVPKTYKPQLITAVLRVVVEGGTYVPPEALKIARRNGDVKAEHELTPRQRDVMRLIVRGYANKEIAEHLNIAKDTVKQHARAAYVALGVSSRMQAMTTLARRGIQLD